MNLKYVRKPGRPHTRKSLTINPFKKHPRDKITSILFWEGETMGPGAKIVIGGLNSWEMSTQHMFYRFIITCCDLSNSCKGINSITSLFNNLSAICGYIRQTFLCSM